MEPWQVALEFRGVPFGHRGRTRNRLDCVGLIVLTANATGLEVRDKRVYGREPWNDGMQAAIRDNLGPPVDREPKVNDIVLMRLHRGAPPSHVGIIAPHPDGLGIIHAYAAAKEVVYHRLNRVWRSRIVEVYPWPDKH